MTLIPVANHLESEMNDLLRFIEKIKADRGLYAEVEKLSSLSQLVALGNSHGYKFSEDDFRHEISGSGELSHYELESVAGSTLDDLASGPANCPCSMQD